MSSVCLKTSETSPLLIAGLPCFPGSGMLGMTLCPGKKDATRHWDRDLQSDILAIRTWDASVVVTLIEDHEFRLLGIENLPSEVATQGMNWRHLPIRDVDVPDERFNRLWPRLGAEIHQCLDAGERILIHCRGGLGRTGLLAAVILVERGCTPKEAIKRVRAARPGTIETAAQESFVLNSSQSTPCR